MLEVSAGAILYTVIDNLKHFLIIKDNHGNYGFPKGHLEENETDLDAALREIREETGIDATIDSSFKESITYIMHNGITKKAIYYLAQFYNQKPSPQQGEVDEILLLPYNEALAILTFDNMKEILINAQRYMENE